MHDVYISADIESDGPIPGRYSMLSFGLAVARHFDGATFTPVDPAAASFYRELRPVSEEFDPLDRAGRDDLPAALRSSRAHTHNAWDDAIEQAEIFARLFKWPGPA